MDRFPFTLTCLQCREFAPLVAIEPVETGGADPWIRLVMGCGHTPSVPVRHREAIEKVASGASGAYGLFDPDGRATAIVRGRPI